MSSKAEKRNYSYVRDKICQERLGIIFNCFKNGLDETCEIQEKLNQHHDNYYLAERRGKVSVAIVKETLLELPYVKEIQEINRYSKQDYKGVDLWVYVSKREDPSSSEKVLVQVKSSNRGVRDFLSTHFGDPNFEKVLPQLKEKKIVVINARIPREQIKNIFTRVIC